MLFSEAADRLLSRRAALGVSCMLSLKPIAWRFMLNDRVMLMKKIVFVADSCIVVDF